MSLFVADNLDKDTHKFLKRQGWKVIDVRLMPNKTDADKAEAVKARLEGVRQGSIDEGSAPLRHLELEARCYGLLDKNKQPLSEFIAMDLSRMDRKISVSRGLRSGAYGIDMNELFL